jgi:hypothetical protein
MATSTGYSHELEPMDDTKQGGIIADQKDRCVCIRCPTYNECMHEKSELLFCITGRSPTCAFEKRGCICPMCPVRETFGLTKAYYCIKGSEQEQGGTLLK